MTAFTYLFSNLSLSLAHQTLTFYPKNDLAFKIFLYEDDGNDELVNIGKSLRSISVDHEDHIYLHEDSYDAKVTHYHIKFPFEINEEKLSLILNVLVRGDLISSEELDSYIKTYKEIKKGSEEQFQSAMLGLSEKQIELEQKAQEEPEIYSSAAGACKELYQQIQEDSQRYFTEKSLVNYNLFFAHSRSGIEKARPFLGATLDLVEQAQSKIMRI